jgi:hypothetical protein
VSVLNHTPERNVSVRIAMFATAGAASALGMKRTMPTPSDEATGGAD